MVSVQVMQIMSAENDQIKIHIIQKKMYLFQKASEIIAMEDVNYISFHYLSLCSLCATQYECQYLQNDLFLLSCLWVLHTHRQKVVGFN